MEMATSTGSSEIERLLATPDADFSSFPGGREAAAYMHLASTLDTGALQILRRTETAEDSGGMGRAGLLEWLRRQSVGSEKFLESARNAQGLADDVLRQRQEENAAKNSEAAEQLLGAVRKQDKDRAKHRSSLLGKCYPNADKPVGIRVEIREPGKKARYELVDAGTVGVDEGFLTAGTPTKGPERGKCTVAKVAAYFGLDADWLLEVNQEVYQHLESKDQKLCSGTLLWLEEDPDEDTDTQEATQEGGAAPLEKSPEALLFRERKRPRDAAPPPPGGGINDIATVVGALVEQAGIAHQLGSPIRKRLNLSKGPMPSGSKVPPTMPDMGGTKVKPAAGAQTATIQRRRGGGARGSATRRSASTRASSGARAAQVSIALRPRRLTL